MSPEAKNRGNEALNIVPVQINWIQSKDVLGDAFEYAFRSEKTRNKDLEPPPQIGNDVLSGLFYRLGHAGRDLEGFDEVTLNTLTSTKPGRSKLPAQFEARLALPSFIGQVSNQIEEYIINARNNPNEDNCGAFDEITDPALTALKQLAQCAPEDAVELNFKKDVVKGYKITQIQMPGITFK